LAAVGVGLWVFGGYGSETATTPHSSPWWQIELITEEAPQVAFPAAEEILASSPAPLAAHTPPITPEAWSMPKGTVRVAAGEALFRLDGSREHTEVIAELTAAGAVYVDSSEASGLIRASFGSEVSAHEALTVARAVPGLAGARPNAITSGASCGPGDLVGYQWERTTTGTPALCADQSNSAPVTIAILDSGVAYEDYTDASGTYVAAPELAGVPFVDPWDFINDDAHANDDHQHGTHLAGLIASQDRLRGHASNPVLMPVKVLDDQMMGTEFSLIEGLHWAADHGAEVVNLSLTFDVGYLPSFELVDAIAAVHLAGGVIVAAAGNQDEGSVAFPAALNGVIAVGAYENDGNDVDRATYSNRGWALDVMGPGGNVGNDEDGDGVPDGMLAQTIDPDDPTALGYWAMAGTSQATAIVSAQAANLVGQGLDPRSIRYGLLLLAKGVDKTNKVRQKEGRGYVDTSAAGDAEDGLTNPGTFVNVVQSISYSGGAHRLNARIEVVDETGQKVPDVWVRGHIAGSVNQQVGVFLDGEGTGTITSAAVSGAASDPVLFSLSIDAVHIERGDAWNNQGFSDPYDNDDTNEYFPVEPGGFYRLDPGNHAHLSAGLGDNPEGGVLFRVSSSDSLGGGTPGDVCTLFDCSEMVDSWMATSLGGGLSSSTVNVSFNWPWFSAIGGAGLSSSTVNVFFGGSYFFPWGSSSDGTVEVWDLSGSGLSSSTVNVFRWNSWMFGSGLSSSTVNVLRFNPYVFGSGSGSTSVYYVDDGSPLWGSGLSSSTVNALDFFGPSSSGGLSSWGGLLGSGLSSSTVNAFRWQSTIWGASAQTSATAVVMGATGGQGSEPTGL